MHDPVAKGRGALEFHALGGLEHLGLKLVEVLLGGLGGLVAADRLADLFLGLDLFLDPAADRLDDPLGSDSVFDIVSKLKGPPTIRLVGGMSVTMGGVPQDMDSSRENPLPSRWLV